MNVKPIFSKYNSDSTSCWKDSKKHITSYLFVHIMESVLAHPPEDIRSGKVLVVHEAILDFIS